MSARRIGIILKLMMILFIMAVISLAVMIAKNATESVLNKSVIAFVVFLVLWLFVLVRVPVRCDRPGCHGRMRQNWVSESPGQSRLQYICERCGEVYETGIGVGLGAP